MMRTSKVLLIDNDVLVYTLVYLHDTDPRQTRTFLSYLLARYSQIWVPETVYDEFLFRVNDKRRKRIIEKYMDMFQAISICPINVARHEINVLTKGEDENAGEADAILQSQKATFHDDYGRNNYQFLTNDKGAIRLAKTKDVEVLSYKSLKDTFREIGIVLP